MTHHTAAPTAPRSFRPDIEGLRGLSVLTIVAYHAGIPLVTGGYVALDLFFVISGFLITRLLLDEHTRTGRISITGFYARRARRLLPAATVTLLATLLASYLIQGRVATLKVGADAVWTALFAANLRFALLSTDYLTGSADPSPLQHYWSLAVEEQFYLLWPVLLLTVAALARRRVRPALAVVLAGLIAASLTWSAVQTATDRNWAYFSPLTRGWELAAGALIAVAVPVLARLPRSAAHVLSVAGLALLTGAVLTYTDTTIFPGLAVIVPTLGSCLLLIAGTSHRAGVEPLVAVAPLQWIGKISYAWYLWHWPFLILGQKALGSSPATVAGLVLGSLAAAAGSFYLLEDPLRRARGLTRSTSASLQMGAAAITVSLTAALVLQLHPYTANGSALDVGTAPATRAELADAVARAAAGADPVDEQLQLRVIAAGDDRAQSRGCSLDLKDDTPPPLSDCTFGAVGASRRVVLLGDSHARMWLPALDKVGRERGWAVILVSKSACPPIEATLSSRQLGRDFPECATWRARAIAAINQARPDLVLVTGAHTGIRVGSGDQFSTDPAQVAATWQAGMTATLQQLRPSGARLVLLGTIPTFPYLPPECLSQQLSDPTRCAGQTAAVVDAAHDQLEAAIAAAAGVDYVQLTSLLCTPEVCPVVIDGLVAYYDMNHVTATFSRWMARPFADAVGVTA